MKLGDFHNPTLLAFEAHQAYCLFPNIGGSLGDRIEASSGRLFPKRFEMPATKFSETGLQFHIVQQQFSIILVPDKTVLARLRNRNIQILNSLSHILWFMKSDQDPPGGYLC